MNLVSVGTEIEMSYNMKLIFLMGKLWMMVSIMFFNWEIFIYFVMSIKCIDMDLLVKVDMPLKCIILSEMMIMAWLYLRSFVNFLSVKYSWEA